MASDGIRYELTPEISRELIAALNSKRAHIFRDKERQKMFLRLVRWIADEVERTGGMYSEPETAALRKIKTRAQKLKSAVDELSDGANLGLFLAFKSVFEQQRKAATTRTRKKVPIVRFRAIKHDVVVKVESQEPCVTHTSQADNSRLNGNHFGLQSFGPAEMLSMLIEAAEYSIVIQDQIPRNRCYPGQTAKGRMFARMLTWAFHFTFREPPGRAREGVFGSILNLLLMKFEEPPIGEDALNTIISEQFPGV